LEPLIIPLDRCLEVQVGVSISFNLSAINLCTPSVATLTDIVVASGITGMTHGNLIHSSTNSSIYYITFTWTPQTNQIGSQQLCTVAYTSENLQSDQYCVTFTVKNSSDTCVTTTTSETTTTTSTTTTSEAATTTWTTTTVGPAARRRRRKSKKKDTCERSSESRLITNELERITASRKILKSNTPTKNCLTYNKVNPRDNMNNASPSDLRISLADSNFSKEVTNLTDKEEQRVSSTVSVKRVKRATIEPLNNTEQLNETENVHIKSPNHLEDSENSRIIRRSAVTVLRVSRLDEANQNNSITPQQSILSASSVKSSKLDQVKVIKIPRNQSALNPPTRAVSVGNVITIKSDKSFIEMKPIIIRSNTASLATNINVHKGNRVTVTKLPRKSTTLQSRPS
ncbi:unnamed protein product, partial [Rotaria sp. Silwood2]